MKFSGLIDNSQVFKNKKILALTLKKQKTCFARIKIYFQNRRNEIPLRLKCENPYIFILYLYKVEDTSFCLLKTSLCHFAPICIGYRVYKKTVCQAKQFQHVVSVSASALVAVAVAVAFSVSVSASMLASAPSRPAGPDKRQFVCAEWERGETLFLKMNLCVYL